MQDWSTCSQRRPPMYSYSIWYNKLVDYNPKKYNVTDKATQPNVIGYAIAASTEALNVTILHYILTIGW